MSGDREPCSVPDGAALAALVAAVDAPGAVTFHRNAERTAVVDPPEAALLPARTGTGPPAGAGCPVIHRDATPAAD